MCKKLTPSLRVVSAGVSTSFTVAEIKIDPGLPRRLGLFTVAPDTGKVALCSRLNLHL